MLGALLQDHKLTSGLGLKEKENLLKDLSMSVFIGESRAGRQMGFYG